MLSLDDIRNEFARFLADNPDARWRMDAALAHVVEIAYQAGIAEGAAEIERLRESISQTLNDNLHLADGDNCTLITLKRALPDWEISE